MKQIIFFLFALVVIGCGGANKKSSEYDPQEKQSNEPESQNEVEEVNAQDLFIETLTKIGCQYKVDEESDRRIHFDYQGEHFFADINEDNSFVHLYDTYWLEVELNKTDEVSRLRKAINTANQSVLVTTLFTIDDDDKCMYVHSRYSFIFGKNIPSLYDYLKAILYYFFEAHRIVTTEVMPQGQVKRCKKEEDL